MPETDHRIYLLAGAALFAIGFYSLLASISTLTEKANADAI